MRMRRLVEFLRLLTEDDLSRGLKAFGAASENPHTHYTARFFGVCVHLVRDGRLAEDVIKAIDADGLAKPPALQPTLGLFGGQGILVSHGSFWQAQRDVLAPALFNVTPRCRHVMEEEMRSLLKGWQRRGGTDNLAGDVRMMLVRTMCRGVMQVDMPEARLVKLAEANRIIIRYRLFLAGLHVFGFDSTRLSRMLPGLTGARHVVRQFVVDLCRSKSAADQDVVASVLRRHDFFNTPTEAQKRQAYEEIVTLLRTASTPTSPLTFAITKLVNDHAQLAKIREELSMPSAEGPRSRCLRELIISAFIEKPPMPFSIPRQAVADMAIGNMHVAKGDYVMIHLESLPASPRLGMLPFMSGKHACAGRNYAVILANTLLSMLAQEKMDMEVREPVAYRCSISRRSSGGSLVCRAQL